MQKGSIKISTSDLQPGMILAEPVCHPATFQTIWNVGTVLTPKHVELIRQMNPPGIKVVDFQGSEKFKGFHPPLAKEPPKSEASPFKQAVQWAGSSFKEVGSSLKEAAVRKAPPPKLSIPKPSPRFKAGAIGHEVLVRNVALVRLIGDQIRSSAEINLQQVDACVQTTIHKIIANKDLINSLSDLRVYDEYTYSHSANVMSLALVTGFAMKYSADKLRVLGIGALLHDLGKNLVPDEVLNKPGRLTTEEMDIMKTHPGNGVMLLNSYSWVNNEIRNMVFQHHEKLDGTGYPMHLAGDSISEMAKIVSVVDFYDALISERVYKKGLPPNVAYQAILDSIPAHFDPRIVQAFQTFIVPYPVNCFVQLNTGEIAKVLKVNRKNLMRPLLSIDGKKVDLEKDRQRSIVCLVVPTA
ncbi:MAG TPA: hypothetical protein DD435_02345 [Cyanobacteria bacterium UBA8530]|nr:hypothetical protein [Cyanobacteria bacterium UBA8530]